MLGLPYPAGHWFYSLLFILRNGELVHHEVNKSELL